MRKGEVVVEKKKRGRPKKEGSMTCQMMIRMPEYYREMIDEFCKKDGVTMSVFMRNLVVKEIRRRGFID